VRSLLGLHDVAGDVKDENNRTNNAMNGGEPLNATATTRRPANATDNTNAGQGGGPNRRVVATTLGEEMMIDTEAAVMANFDFLSSEVLLNCSQKSDQCFKFMRGF
jgi:hypothetical protein